MVVSTKKIPRWFEEKILKTPYLLYALSGPFIFYNYLQHHFLRQRTPFSP
jgi:hypothetical protein